MNSLRSLEQHLGWSAEIEACRSRADSERHSTGCPANAWTFANTCLNTQVQRKAKCWATMHLYSSRSARTSLLLTLLGVHADHLCADRACRTYISYRQWTQKLTLALFAFFLAILFFRRQDRVLVATLEALQPT